MNIETNAINSTKRIQNFNTQNDNNSDSVKFSDELKELEGGAVNHE